MFVIFLALVIVTTPQPIMSGKATYYNPYEWAITKAGRIPIMQNGHIHDITAFTAAVSLDRWLELAGATLRVCVQPELVSATYKLDCSYEQSYDESMNNLCSYGSAMGCEPLQRRKQNDLPKVVSVTAAAVATANSGARPCEAISSGEVLPTSRLESCTTQPKCIIVVVSDTGDAAEFAEHGVVVDLSVAAFRALRPYGMLFDNDGALQVEVWRTE
jgi:hypothetical protein